MLTTLVAQGIADVLGNVTISPNGPINQRDLWAESTVDPERGFGAHRHPVHPRRRRQ